jgi:hypothetical protein
MAENIRYRQTQHDDEHEPQAARPAQNDPLAELARLIGQNDPFAEFGRGNARAPAHPAPEAHDQGAAPAPQWLSRATPSYADPQPAAHDPYAAPHQEAGHYDPAHYDATQYDANQYDTGHYDPAAYQDQAGAPEPYVPQDPHHAHGYGQQDGAYDAPAVDPYRMEDAAYHAAGDAQGYYPDEAGAETEEAPRERRRGGMMTIAAVLGLALVGTAGAFGYRAFTGGSTSGGEPPVIKADPTPSKVTPTKTAETQPNKLIYDRVGEPTQAEPRLVPREEQPVDIKPQQQARLPAGAPGGAAAPMGAAPVGAFPPSVNEPKKVKTQQIRPDQMGAPAAPTQAPVPQVAARPLPPAPAAPAAQPRRTDGPMAIAPQAAPQQPARTAALPPQPAATRGGYMVQVSSQKTEADAQASYRSLQSRYGAVLGSRDATIRRADLGDKGIYYRAQVGPLGADQANALCNDLKSAGGTCVVVKN